MTPADRAAAAAARPSGAQPWRAAGASVSPAGRRRHSGAERSPLPHCPSYPDRVPFRGGPRRLRAPSQAFLAPYRPGGRGCGGRLSEKQSQEIRVAGRELWSPGWWLHRSSLLAGRQGSRRGAGVLCHPGGALTLTLQRSAPAGWRIPESPPRCRIVGSCAICAAGLVNCFLPGRRSRPTRFCRGVARV